MSDAYPITTVFALFGLTRADFGLVVVFLMTLVGAAAIPSAVVIGVLYLLLRHRNCPVLWSMCLAGVVVWCMYAAWTFRPLLALIVGNDNWRDAAPQNGNGILAIFGALVSLMVWGVAAGPAFPTLAMILISYPLRFRRNARKQHDSPDHR